MPPTGFKPLFLSFSKYHHNWRQTTSPWLLPALPQRAISNSSAYFFDKHHCYLLSATFPLKREWSQQAATSSAFVWSKITTDGKSGISFCWICCNKLRTLFFGFSQDWHNWLRTVSPQWAANAIASRAVNTIATMRYQQYQHNGLQTDAHNDAAAVLLHRAGDCITSTCLICNCHNVPLTVSTQSSVNSISTWDANTFALGFHWNHNNGLQ